MNGSITLLLKRGTTTFRVLSCATFAFSAASASALSLYSKIHHSLASEGTPEKCQPMPYLAAVGVVPLRFAPAPEPATLRPPKPEVIPDAAAARPKNSSTEVAKPETVTAKPIAESVKTPATAPSSDSTPVSILPDDTPRDVHAEDVLPYFQRPNGERSANGIAVPFTPASPTLPQSSATYELK